MCGLSIILINNITSVDFLDVKFNLKTESYQPFRKPNNEPKYIDISSNHPPQVSKQLPKSIEKRLSKTLSCKEIFDNSKHLYKKALQESGFKEKLCYQQKDVNANSNQEKKKCQHKIIWFNPPFSKSVKTNLGKELFKLLKGHFPNRHKMSKIFNKNTIKLSHSCCRNISSKISTSYNQRIINPPLTNYGCNCRNRSNCLLDNKCLTPSIVYRAIVSAIHKPNKKYFGISETPFKDNYNNHTRDFRHKEYVNSMEQSKYIWKLKDEGETPSITWNIMSVVNCHPRGGVCRSCLTEKLWLLKHFNDVNLLNKKSEFISKCRHANKLLIKSVEKG